jgi:hypothetical protein
VDTTIEESYEDQLEVTEHPVEAGAQISDHSFKRPMELILHCGWSNAFDQTTSPNSGFAGSFTGGAMAASDYIAQVYSQLLQLQESRTTVTVQTGLRAYDDMLIVSLRVRRDQRTRFALMVEAVLKQVILVSTQSATITPQSVQQTPQNTADVSNQGAQYLTQSPQPASGGSLSPSTVQQEVTVAFGAP